MDIIFEDDEQAASIISPPAVLTARTLAWHEVVIVSLTDNNKLW